MGGGIDFERAAHIGLGQIATLFIEETFGTGYRISMRNIVYPDKIHLGIPVEKDIYFVPWDDVVSIVGDALTKPSSDAYDKG